MELIKLLRMLLLNLRQHKGNNRWLQKIYLQETQELCLGLSLLEENKGQLHILPSKVNAIVTIQI